MNVFGQATDRRHEYGHGQFGRHSCRSFYLFIVFPPFVIAAIIIQHLEQRITDDELRIAIEARVTQFFFFI